MGRLVLKAPLTSFQNFEYPQVLLCIIFLDEVPKGHTSALRGIPFTTAPVFYVGQWCDTSMLQGLAPGLITPNDSVGSYNMGSEVPHGRMSPMPGGPGGSFEALVAALPATAHTHNLSLSPSPTSGPLYSASTLDRPLTNKRPRRDWENSTNCPQDFALDLPAMVMFTAWCTC